VNTKLVLPNGSDVWLQPRYAHTYGHITVRTRLCSPPGPTSLSHDARVLTCLTCAQHDLPGARAGRCGLVAYARQQLRWMAAAAEGKYVIGAAQRLGSVAATEVGGLVADARQRLGCMVAAEMRTFVLISPQQLGWVARLDSTHTLVYAHGPFKRALICVLSPSPRLAPHA